MLAPVKKDMRGANKELADAVKALDNVVQQHLTKAERENATVYLQVCIRSMLTRSRTGRSCARGHAAAPDQGGA